MSDPLPLFRSFIRVVEAGSFSAAAQQAGTSQPTISRQVAALEQHLGCLLFQRTTRRLTLTEDGSAFYETALRALEAVAEAEGSVGRRKGRPSGTLRLAAAAVMGRLHILPRLPRLMDRHPDLAVDLVLSDGFTDLVEQGIDLAVRVGVLEDPGLVARRIGTSRRLVVATPGYLAQHGVPQTPEDLRAHACIRYAGLATGTGWSFARRGGEAAQVTVQVGGRLRVSTTEAVRAAALEGLGIALVPQWHFGHGEFAAGRLVALLPDWEAQALPIHAIYPTRRFLAPKVRAAVDFLAEEFAADPLLAG
ncbi:LysR family transcriptional regulator [Falsiroseomonas selenitidurans]|uniref:LysR family transcriptional regulator n=1 Tax=Falsiroseomonas selenitidurans TaxID=2716335 RepID=A0ABX1EC96_9PROT|nr:LysR family transcriptional regulator [Falsiroseomonas selenitidurans]NKC34483.1 LysR family transcriptional regulator [Falsiroseomonas selenitidurans]